MSPGETGMQSRHSPSVLRQPSAGIGHVEEAAFDDGTPARIGAVTTRSRSSLIYSTWPQDDLRKSPRNRELLNRAVAVSGLTRAREVRPA